MYLKICHLYFKLPGTLPITILISKWFSWRRVALKNSHWFSARLSWDFYPYLTLTPVPVLLISSKIVSEMLLSIISQIVGLQRSPFSFDQVPRSRVQADCIARTDHGNPLPDESPISLPGPGAAMKVTLLPYCCSTKLTTYFCSYNSISFLSSPT